jgi:hypothetical protein
MGVRSALHAAINRGLVYWPVPDDDDFRRLTGRVADIGTKGLVDFYTEWLPIATGVAGASVRLQESENSHAEGPLVGLNVRQSRSFKTARERLASVHATMWHEAAHVRHPIPASWYDQLGGREPDVGAGQLFAAFQMLEDLRVERELVNFRPQAGPWLRYQLGCYGGMVSLAVRYGKQADCGWAMAATVTAGRAVAGVINRETLERITSAEKRLAAETTRLWDLWESYAMLTDAERDSGVADPHVFAFARLLPESISGASSDPSQNDGHQLAP